MSYDYIWALVILVFVVAPAFGAWALHWRPNEK